MRLLAATLAQVAAAATLATDVVVPVTGRAPGTPAPARCTSVIVHNPGAVAAEVRLLPLAEAQEGATASALVVSLGPGETTRIDDAARLVCRERACGALRVASRARVVVRWAPCAAAGASPPHGGDAATRAAVPAALAVGVGERTDVPAGLAGCQLTIAEVAGRKVRARVTPRDAGGTALADAAECDVAAWSTVTFRCAERFPGLAAPVARLIVTPVSGDGRLVCFGDPSEAAGEP